MRKLGLIAVLFAAAAAPAYAQEQQQQQRSKTPMQLIDEARKGERAQTDQAYDAAMRARRQAPDAAGAADPWASVRPAAEPTRTAKKPAKKPPAQ